MKKYKQLNLEELVTIKVLLQQGKSNSVKINPRWGKKQIY